MKKAKIIFALMLTLICIRCCSIEVLASNSNIIERTVKLTPKKNLIIIHIEETNALSYFSEDIQVLVDKSTKEHILDTVDNNIKHIECLAKIMWTEGGGESIEYQAAVAWTVFNHLDRGDWGTTLTDVITYPGHFAWDKNAPINNLQLELAKDIFIRWSLEKEGFTDVGRILPPEYIYFWANSKGECRFNTVYGVKEGAWDWSLPSPYESWQDN